MYSSSLATRRSLIPVRVAIHSSEVSTIFSRSAFVRTRSGSAEPVPRITARRSPRVIEPPHSRVGAGRHLRLRRPDRGQLEHLVAYPVVHAVLDEIVRDANGVLDGAHRGAAVTDDSCGL